MVPIFNQRLSRFNSEIFEYYGQNGWSIFVKTLCSEMDVLYLLFNLLLDACRRLDRLYNVLGASTYYIERC